MTSKSLKRDTFKVVATPKVLVVGEPFRALAVGSAPTKEEADKIVAWAKEAPEGSLIFGMNVYSEGPINFRRTIQAFLVYSEAVTKMSSARTPAMMHSAGRAADFALKEFSAAYAADIGSTIDEIGCAVPDINTIEFVLKNHDPDAEMSS